MTRSAGPLVACALALLSAQANAQAGATPPAAADREADQAAVPVEPQPPAANPPTADDVCRTLEQSAAENALPVEFFARVIWQESRFNARAVSPKGASGIAQFMPQTLAGMASLIRSTLSRRCAIRRVTCANCETGLAILDSLRRPTMQVRAA
jgi:soluble lytic murein transglycosylase-like protein